MKKYIYLIKSESSLGEEIYKIGLTKKDPNKRLKQLQTGNPNILKIVHIFESNFANLLESTLHKVYEIKRVNGEWFEMDDTEINNFLSLCEKTENNFNILAESNTYFQKNYLK